MESKDLVHDVMQQLENDNGTYNEEKGLFNKQNQPVEQVSRLFQLQKQLLNTITNNPDLRNIINSSEKRQHIIGQILQNENILQQLVNDPNNVNVLTEILTEGSEDEQSVNIPMPPALATPTQNTKPVQSKQSVDKDSVPPLDLVSTNTVKQEPTFGSFSFLGLMAGPLIAMVCFFLVTQTPILFYISKIPYIGYYLVNNKLITELLLTGVLFFSLSVLLEFSGLI